MNQSAQRILNAIQGDTQAITALASAIARDDVPAVQALLAQRGVTLSDAEVREVTQGATAGGASAFTWTCTYTYTCT